MIIQSLLLMIVNKLVISYTFYCINLPIVLPISINGEFRLFLFSSYKVGHITLPYC